jgi:hypothetical protein
MLHVSREMIKARLYRKMIPYPYRSINAQTPVGRENPTIVRLAPNRWKTDRGVDVFTDTVGRKWSGKPLSSSRPPEKFNNTSIERTPSHFSNPP